MAFPDRTRLQSLMQREQKRFVNERPKSKALFERGKKSLLSGVPMNWMVKWAGAFPPFVREAQGAHFRRRRPSLRRPSSGTPAHDWPFSSAAVWARSKSRSARHALMLLSEDAVFVAVKPQNRFDSPTGVRPDLADANRFHSPARQITGRPKILPQLVLSRFGGRNLHHPPS